MYKKSDYNLYYEMQNKLYAYNTISGALVALDRELEIEKYNDNEQSTLFQQGLIVHDNLNETNLLICQRGWTKWNPTPSGIVFTVATTMECQAKCSYCFEKSNMNSKRMSEETAIATAEFIITRVKTSRTKKVQITFFGGEPTLNVEAIETIGKRVKNYCDINNVKFVSTIITNGILLDKIVLEKLISINLNRAQITLDGTEEKHNEVKGLDCFQQVIKNIDYACGYIDINIRLNVTKQNRKDLIMLLDELNEIFCDSEHIKVYTAMVRNDFVGCISENENLLIDEYCDFVDQLYHKFSFSNLISKERLLPKIGRTYCSFESFYNCCIGPEGEMYKCEHDLGVTKSRIGNVWNGNSLDDNEMFFYSGFKDICIQSKCKYMPICLGGCKMENRDGICEKCVDRKKYFDRLIYTYITLTKH